MRVQSGPAGGSGGGSGSGADSGCCLAGSGSVKGPGVGAVYRPCIDCGILSLVKKYNSSCHV